jgi:hypothetical protein
MGTVIPMKKKIDSNLVAMLQYKVLEHGYTPEEIALCIGVKENSWFRRKREPKMFRLSELEELTKRLGVVIIIDGGKTTAKDKEVQ